MKIEGLLKGRSHTFDISLTSQASGMIFQDSPTISAGDVTVGVADGTGALSFSNITTLPTVSGKNVLVTLSDAEMDYDRIKVMFSDVSGSQWADAFVMIQTTPFLSVEVVSGASTTGFVCDLATSIDIKDTTIYAASGSLKGEQQQITSYNTGTKTITCDAFTGTPSVGDLFLVLGKKVD